MNNAIAIDIETVPLPADQAELDAFRLGVKLPFEYAQFPSPLAPTSEDFEIFRSSVYTPHKTLKDPEKIQAHYETARRKFFDEAREIPAKAEADWLSGRKFQVGGCRIISLAIATTDGSKVTSVRSHYERDNEREIAEFLLDEVAASNAKWNVGYNSEGFDIPQLIGLLSRTSLRLPKRWGKAGQIDLYYELGKRGKLKDLIKGYGIKHAVPDMDGSKIEEAFNQGADTLIREYNEEDARVTAELFNHACRWYDFGSW